jgi:secreted Zn-dependent insulinase-like peptidase
VSAQPHFQSQICGGTILIQSSKYPADYLESRINSFLEGLVDFTDEQVENVKSAQIKEFEQVLTNTYQEGQRLMRLIKVENYDFDLYDKSKEATR